MTRDRPDAAELLSIARTVLREAVAPGLAGEARFNVLMVANAMAMAIREFQQGAGLDGAEEADLRSLYDAPDTTTATAEDLSRRLAADIRAGQFDEDPKAAALHRLLLADIRRRLAIGNPRYLAESDGDA